MVCCKDNRERSSSVICATQLKVGNDVRQQMAATNTFPDDITIIRQVCEVHVKVIVCGQVVHEHSDQRRVNPPHALNGSE